jgi:sulfur-oxidizing protein SoxZ
MADSVKIRAKQLGSSVEVKLLIAHEMETGLRKTPEGVLVPAWFIQTITVMCNGLVVLKAQCGTAVSKNPFLSFTFSGGKKGDRIQVQWVDNKGGQGKGEARVS